MNTVENLIRVISRLPGIGPKSGRKIALHLMKNRTTSAQELVSVITLMQEEVSECSSCNALTVGNPCDICSDALRRDEILCIVADVSDLWALEKAAVFKGRYFVLGGLLSVFDGITPDDLNIKRLQDRVQADVQAGLLTEVIIALPATIEGQTTAHYIAEKIRQVAPHVTVSQPAVGIPVGGELDYLDDNTLQTAISSRLRL
ncbi:MAG: recombination mediator RecR [Alphaproteobacteria bacterium]|nr:recombination mediator RecR [Alphaproteobacteria bacterium]